MVDPARLAERGRSHYWGDDEADQAAAEGIESPAALVWPWDGPKWAMVSCICCWQMSVVALCCDAVLALATL